MLIEFYRKVRPSGPGWSAIRAAANLPAREEAATALNVPMALLGWWAGCVMIWSALFATGAFLYGRTTQAAIITAVFIGSALIVRKALNTLAPE